MLHDASLIIAALFYIIVDSFTGTVISFSHPDSVVVFIIFAVISFLVIVLLSSLVIVVVVVNPVQLPKYRRRPVLGNLALELICVNRSV